MNFFKKYILLLLILPEISIKSAYMFKDAKNQFRDINPYDYKQLETLDRTIIPSEEIIIGFGPNDEYVKIAFLEEKSNGKYQMHFFTLLNPKKSSEFTSKEDAQFALKSFMLDPVEKVSTKRSYLTPLPARGSGQGWRSTSSKNSSRRK